MKLIGCFMIAAIFSALLTGDLIAQQIDSNKGKKAVAAAPGTTGQASTAVQSVSSYSDKVSEVSERERLLHYRIDKLEQKLARLESSSAVKPADESVQPVLTTPEIASPTALAKPDDPRMEAAVVAAEPGKSTSQSNEPKKKVTVAFADFTWLTGNSRTRELSINLATPSTTNSDQNAASSTTPWQYGGFLDLGYLLGFNHPSNHLFRSRGTTFHVDNLYVNMAAVYGKRKISEESRWGAEFTAQGGKDSELFGFSATAPNIGGFKWLRHLGPTNVSYVAPVGKGLTVQGGIFASLIGYDSLYAKDNFNYTRPWGADFTPYLMMGVNVSYPFNDKLSGAVFVINGYWHLADANNVPSSGGQVAYKATPHVTVKETVLWGPHQTDTSLKYWRSLSDTIVERRGDRVTFAFEYIYSSERVVAPGNPRALMMSGQLPVHWILNKLWSVTVRPEVFWDRDGRWTLARQTVKAITTTLEYRIPYKETNTILRLEHRWDDSRGPDGGFFRGGEVRPGVLGLTPAQHVLVFGLMFTFDR